MLFLAIAAAAFVTEIFARREIINKELARKILHLVAIFISGYSVYLIESFDVLIGFTIAGCVGTLWLLKEDVIKAIHPKERKSWGIFFFPLALLVLLVVFGKDYKWVIFISMTILAFSDSAAAIAGTFFNQTFYNLTSDRKSVIGNLTFAITTFIIVFFLTTDISRALLPGFEYELPMNTYLMVATVAISIILTAFEAISSKGFDNFTVPITAGLLFYIFFNTPDPAILNNFLLGMALAGAVAIVSYKMKLLTSDGSVAVFLLASFIFGFGGWQWSVPILVFFFTSSFLSKVKKKARADVEQFFEKSSKRDFMQVLANGGIGGALVIANAIYPYEKFYLIYMVSLSVVCADTWATEIGTLRNAHTYNILTFKPIEQGMSGGVSLRGSLGALLGAVVIAISGAYWIDNNLTFYFVLIIASGFAGNYIDSIYGASLQLQYQCGECGKLTERKIHCGRDTAKYRGINRLNNDAVNFFSALTIVVLAYVLFL